MSGETAGTMDHIGGPKTQRAAADIGADQQHRRVLISVIIPHLNQPAGLRDCLDSIVAQKLPADQFEVIVVDNGSREMPASIVSDYAGARLLREMRPGPGLARNIGAHHANGEILAFIDADCRAHPNWLGSIKAAFDNAAPGKILGGDVQIWRAPGRPMTGVEAYENLFAYRFKMYIEQHGYCGTGNLAVRQIDFNTIGPFAGIDVAEDMEWGQRACASGYKFVYVPEMIVYHPPRETLEELRIKWDRQIQHYFNMAEGTSAWRWRWAARAMLVLASPLRDLPRVMCTSRIQGLSARLKACAVLCAIRLHRSQKMLHVLFGERSFVWNRDTGV